MVYSAAKSNPKLTLEWAKTPDVGLPRPDIVIFLDVGPGAAESRGGYGEEKYEKRDMQEMARNIFLSLKTYSGDEEDDMEVVNAGNSIEEVGRGIWEKLEDRRLFQAIDKDLRVVTAWK